MEKKILKVMAAVMAMVIVFSFHVIPASAYFERGQVEVSCGTNNVSVEAAQETYVSVSVFPLEDSHPPGCGMGECPDSCGPGCADENGNCICAGDVYQNYSTSVSVTSSNPAVAVGSYYGGTLVITGISPGDAIITLTANLVEWASGGASVNVHVPAPAQQPDPEPSQPSQPDPKPSQPDPKPSQPDPKPSQPDPKPSQPNPKPSQPVQPDDNKGKGNQQGTGQQGTGQQGKGQQNGQTGGSSSNQSGNTQNSVTGDSTGNLAGGSSGTSTGDSSGTSASGQEGGSVQSGGGSTSSGVSQAEAEKTKELMEEMGAEADSHKTATVTVPDLAPEKEWTVYSLGDGSDEEESATGNAKKDPLKTAAAGTSALLFLGGILGELIGYKIRKD
ncbi:MAG: hypothetical protein QM793_00445 [Muricomes sp.]